MSYSLRPLATGTAPPLMHFPLARRYLLAGYAMRRAAWTGLAGQHELAWIRHYGGGLYLYVNGEGARVVRNTDVTATDLRAWDWTMLPPTCDFDAVLCACQGNAALFSLPGYPESEADTPAETDLLSAPNLRMGISGCALPPADWRKRATDQCDCAPPRVRDPDNPDGPQCPPGTTLKFGVCVPDGDPPPPCPPGSTRINGVCVPTGNPGDGTGGPGGGNGGGSGSDSDGSDAGGSGGSGGSGSGSSSGGGGGGGNRGGGNKRPQSPPSPSFEVDGELLSGPSCYDSPTCATGQRYSVSVTITAENFNSNDGDSFSNWFWSITLKGQVRNGTVNHGGNFNAEFVLENVLAGQTFMASVLVYKPVRNGASKRLNTEVKMPPCCCPAGETYDWYSRTCHPCPYPLIFCPNAEGESPGPNARCVPGCDFDEQLNPVTCECEAVSCDDCE